MSGAAAARHAPPTFSGAPRRRAAACSLPLSRPRSQRRSLARRCGGDSGTALAAAAHTSGARSCRRGLALSPVAHSQYPLWRLACSCAGHARGVPAVTPACAAKYTRLGLGARAISYSSGDLHVIDATWPFGLGGMYAHQTTLRRHCAAATPPRRAASHCGAAAMAARRYTPRGSRVWTRSDVLACLHTVP
jgi:hypothetical protein